MTNFYECKLCNFKNEDKEKLNRHKKTKKHKNNVKKSKIVLCECGEEFNKQYSLLRHKKTCYIEQEFANGEELKRLKKEIEKMKEFQLLKDDLQEQLRVKDEQHKNELIKVYESCKGSITNNTTNNNIICSDEFLKQHCGDALNMEDFIKSIVLEVNDLLYSGKHGYKDGMAKILNSRLKTLGPEKRPIHCTDVKRSKFMVKDENEWKRDKDNKILLRGVEILNGKQYSLLKNWDDDETFFEVTYGITPTDSAKKLMKDVALMVEIKGAMSELGYKDIG